MPTIEKLTVAAWDTVLDFLELNDYAHLLCTCHQIHALLKHDRAFERYVRLKYPANTLGLAPYHGSWKALLQDGNAENGVHVRYINVVANWKFNSSLYFYTNAVRCLVWDRKNHTISVIVEGFGHWDLRGAGSTFIDKVTPDQLSLDTEPETGVVHTLMSIFTNKMAPIRLTPDAVYPQTGMIHSWIAGYHDISKLIFRETLLDPNCSYFFTYNGGIDYQRKLFLSLRNISSISDWFGVQLRHEDQYSNPLCRFVARRNMPDLLKPSNVLEWPIDLPESIRELHRQDRWGKINSSKTDALSKSFKGEYHLGKRKSEAQRIRAKYPDRVPVICEKDDRSDIPDIIKRKYLLPAALTAGKFCDLIRSRIKGAPALFLFCSSSSPPYTAVMSTLHEEHKDEDGFLYIQYSEHEFCAKDSRIIVAEQHEGFLFDNWQVIRVK